MDGLVRSVGGGIGFFFTSAAAAVGNAINAVSAQIDRVIPGGSLPIVLVGITAVLLAVYVARH
jgi:hypothetical protein